MDSESIVLVACIAWLAWCAYARIRARDLASLDLETESTAPDATAGSAVFNGEKLGDGMYPAVGWVSCDGGLGTGVVIARNKVLTAGHCVAGKSPKDIYFYVGKSSKAEMERQPKKYRYGVSRFEYMHRKEGEYTVDWAVLTLKRDVRGAIASVRGLNAPSLPLKKGQTLTVVGYGFITDHKRPIMKHRGTVVVDKASRKFITVARGPGGQLGCSGDSGAPVYQDGAVVGIHVRRTAASGGNCSTAKQGRGGVVRTSQIPWKKALS